MDTVWDSFSWWVENGCETCCILRYFLSLLILKWSTLTVLLGVVKHDNGVLLALNSLDVVTMFLLLSCTLVLPTNPKLDITLWWFHGFTVAITRITEDCPKVDDIIIVDKKITVMGIGISNDRSNESGCIDFAVRRGYSLRIIISLEALYRGWEDVCLMSLRFNFCDVCCVDDIMIIIFFIIRSKFRFCFAYSHPTED